MQLQTRKCIVRIPHENGTFAHISISFPELYPKNAAPSFQFLPSTTIPLSLQTNLRKVNLFFSYIWVMVFRT